MTKKRTATKLVSIDDLQNLFAALSNGLANARRSLRYTAVALAEHHLTPEPTRLAVYLSGIAGETDAILSLCESRLLHAASMSDTDVGQRLETLANEHREFATRTAKLRAGMQKEGIIDELAKSRKGKPRGKTRR